MFTDWATQRKRLTRCCRCPHAAGYVAIPVTIVAIILGAVIAKALLKKHFEKARCRMMYRIDPRILIFQIIVSGVCIFWIFSPVGMAVEIIF